MANSTKETKVMITGATGYVAGWIVKKLLDEGYIVHAPVRNPDDPEKLKYLNELSANAPGEIHFFKADLLTEGSYETAMKECEIVFHTASPFFINVKNPLKDLIEPAQLGTRNVLEQAKKIPSVKRVVLTSSCAAIYGDNKDLQNTKTGMYTEEYWNETSSLDHQPYSYSKTLAEKEAWKIYESQKQWDLVVVNPSLVLGPGINPNGTSESFNLVRQLGDGTMKAGVPDWSLGAVDVRDLANAHYQAAIKPEAKGRHIISGHNSSFFEMAQILSKRYGNKYPLPKKLMPKWLIWLFGPMIDKSMTRKVVSRNLNYALKFDHSKSVKELGVQYRPLEESMVDFFQQMIDHQLVQEV